MRGGSGGGAGDKRGGAGAVEHAAAREKRAAAITALRMVSEANATGEGLIPKEELTDHERLAELAAGPPSLFALVDGEGRVQRIRAQARPPRAGEVRGFSVHAGVSAPAGDVQRRRRIVRYCLRPAFAASQFRATRDGRVAFQLRHPRADGATHIVLPEPAVLHRLAALVPAPGRHAVKYFGVLSSASPLRAEVVPTVPLTLDLPSAVLCEGAPGAERASFAPSHVGPAATPGLRERLDALPQLRRQAEVHLGDHGRQGDASDPRPPRPRRRAAAADTTASRSTQPVRWLRGGGGEHDVGALRGGAPRVGRSPTPVALQAPVRNATARYSAPGPRGLASHKRAEPRLTARSRGSILLSVLCPLLLVASGQTARLATGEVTL